MSDLRNITVWTACTNASGSPALVKNTIQATEEQIDNGDHYDLAADIVTNGGYVGNFVHFDENEVNPILKAAEQIRPLRPVIINNNVDQYPEVSDNPDGILVSLRDYQCASNEIGDSDSGLKKFIENYEDSACRDENGYWYVERGNVSRPTWQEDLQLKDDRECWLRSLEHDGMSVKIMVSDDCLSVFVYGDDNDQADELGKKPAAGELTVGMDQLEINAVPDVIEFDIKTGEGDLKQYAYITLLGVAVTIKQENEGLVIDVSPEDFSDVVESTYVYYNEIRPEDDEESDDEGANLAP